MRFNLETGQQLDTWKKQLDYAKMNYKEEALAQEKQKIIQEMQNYLSTYNTAVAKAQEEIKKELSELERPVAIQQRKLNAEEITQLNYATKVMLSRLQGAVAGGAADVIGVLKDIVEQGDRQSRWALVDSIHEVFATVEKLIEIPAKDELNVRGRLKSQIDEQYKAAMDSLKTPEKLAADQAYTEKKTELESEQFNLSFHSGNAKARVEHELNALKGDYFSIREKTEHNFS
ncbi:hypothetical protein ABE021_10140 [Sporosarcina gallistercoris]|uniref:hypothetical protein n=1 Tax=Sporosarcina gallistercoris TaxID=2762245 RepID=UPI003D2E4632